MKTLILRLGLAIFLIALGIVPIVSDAQSSGTFGYGYAHEAPDGTWILNVINPAGETTAMPLPVQIGATIVNVTASPNGQWLMLYSVHQYESTIQIVNLPTGETRLVDQGYFEDSGLSSIEVIPQWSPDSQYLVYNLISSESFVSDAFVYSVAESARSLVWGGYPLLYPYEVAWSPDGTQLAVVLERCTQYSDNTVACSSSIEHFNIPALEHLGRATLEYDLGYACDLTWSPDGAFIVFHASCDNRISFFNEIFLFDVAQNTIQQVTSFTNPAPLGSTLDVLGYRNFYDFTWSADSQLLAGIVRARGGTQIDPATFSAGSFAYPYPFVTPTPFSTQVAMDWAQNPVDGAFAYRAEAIQLDGENALATVNRQTKIATYQTSTLTEIATGAPGCDYRWSPDGARLMYRGVSATTPGIACSLSNTFVLYQSASSSFSTYAVDDYVWPAGWVVLPSTPPTPTPEQPSSDLISGAIELPDAPGNVSANTVASATVSATDPIPCATERTNTVWYRYTPGSDGWLRVSTFGSSYDTVIAAYTGTEGALTEVACNDDAPGTTASSIRFAVTSETPVYIMVANKGSEALSGSHTLRLGYEPI